MCHKREWKSKNEIGHYVLINWIHSTTLIARYKQTRFSQFANNWIRITSLRQRPSAELNRLSATFAACFFHIAGHYPTAFSQRTHCSQKLSLQNRSNIENILCIDNIN